MPPELPDLTTILAEKFPNNTFFHYLYIWQPIVYSLLVVCVLVLVSYLGTRKISFIPGRLQGALEILVGGLDDFICGILGPKGRKYTPFLGTLFVYILFMNLWGIIPFMRSATANWSITLALALCVFCYVQYTAIREMGFLGYLDHMAGRPRGALALSVLLPLLLLVMHILSELIKPISLSLRLRSNIWGEDVLLAVLAGFGVSGIPLVLVNMLAMLLTAVVQAVVFTLLSTIYFALILTHEPETH